MSEQNSNGCESDGGEEVSGELVVSRGDAPEVFEFVEEPFDEVALAIDLDIDRSLDLDVALGWDVRDGAAGLNEFDDGAGVVTAIGDHVAGQGQSVEQRRRGGFVGGLAGRQNEPDRQPAGIDYGVNFGAQSATRTTDGVIRARFFPPAACWWARTIEESIR